MNEIKNRLLYVLISILISSVALYFSSASSGGKALKTAAALFVLCTFLYPVKEKVSFDDFFRNIEENVTSQTVDEINSALIKSSEYEIKTHISEILEEKNIVYKNISIQLYDENNELKIKKLIITADKKYSDMQNEINGEIMKIYGTESEFIWE